jgi:hypothetical protein
MKNLKTHILERLKISKNPKENFDEQLDELLTSLSLDTAEHAYGMFCLSSEDDYNKAKNAIVDWFNDNVSHGIQYYSPEKIDKYTINNEDLCNKIIIDTDDFCGECDTSNVNALFYSTYLDIEESIDYTTLMIRCHSDESYYDFSLYVKAL